MKSLHVHFALDHTSGGLESQLPLQYQLYFHCLQYVLLLAQRSISILSAKYRKLPFLLVLLQYIDIIVLRWYQKHRGNFPLSELWFQIVCKLGRK